MSIYGIPEGYALMHARLIAQDAYIHPSRLSMGECYLYAPPGAFPRPVQIVGYCSAGGPTGKAEYYVREVLPEGGLEEMTETVSPEYFKLDRYAMGGIMSTFSDRTGRDVSRRRKILGSNRTRMRVELEVREVAGLANGGYVGGVV